RSVDDGRVRQGEIHRVHRGERIVERSWLRPKLIEHADDPKGATLDDERAPEPSSPAERTRLQRVVHHRDRSGVTIGGVVPRATVAPSRIEQPKELARA